MNPHPLYSAKQPSVETDVVQACSKSSFSQRQPVVSCAEASDITPPTHSFAAHFEKDKAGGFVSLSLAQGLLKLSTG